MYYECGTCTLTFDTKVQCKKHSRIHRLNGEIINTVKCNYCREQFSDESELRIHQRHTRHGLNATIKCNRCSERFLRKGDLHFHKRFGQCNGV